MGLGEEIDKIVAILFSLAILFNGYLVGKYVKTFLFPACIFSFFWFGYTFFPLVFLMKVPINPASVLYIFVCVVFFSISSLVFNWNKAFRRNRKKTRHDLNYLHSPFLRKAFYGMSSCVLAFLLIDLKIQGFHLTDFVFNFFETSNRFMVKRYAHEIISNPFSQLANVLNYALVILGGVLLGNNEENRGVGYRYLLAFVAVFPSVFITLTQAAKGTILLSFVLFYGGILMSKIALNKFELTNRKTNVRFLYIVLLLFVVMFFSFMSRGLHEMQMKQALDKLLFYFNSYAFAHLYAFSDWFEFVLYKKSVMNYPATDKYYGFYTFMSLFKVLGSERTVPDGVFDEYFYYKDIIKSNIYTVFRGGILDFGVLGSILFWLIAGLFSHLNFYFLLSTKKPIVYVPLFAMMLGFFYTTFIISLFIWKSIFGSVLVMITILYTSKFKFKWK